MNKNLAGMALTLIASSVLVACGGGGGSTPATTPANNTPANNTPVAPGAPAAATPTPVTATALASIQAQLTAYQNKFATTLPLATDPALAALFAPTSLNNGDNAAQQIAFDTTPGPTQFIIGDTFSAPIAVNSLDVGAVPNDATHQWFATSLAKGSSGQYFTMLAIKDAVSGKWLLAGNQRIVGIGAAAFALQSISAPPVAPAPAIPNSISSGMTLEIFSNSVGSMNGVTSATVSGPGVIGATAGVAGTATFGPQVAAPVGTASFLPLCTAAVAANPATGAPAMAAISTNCIDKTKVVAGTYTFNVLGTDPVTTLPFNLTYKEAIKGGVPANLTAANFPVINAASTAKAGYTSGATVAVNWTVPAAQSASNVWMMGFDATAGTNLFTFNLPATGAAGTTINTTTVLPVFPAGSTLGMLQVEAMTYDAYGVIYTTVKMY